MLVVLSMFLPLYSKDELFSLGSSGYYFIGTQYHKMVEVCLFFNSFYRTYINNYFPSLAYLNWSLFSIDMQIYYFFKQNSMRQSRLVLHFI